MIAYNLIWVNGLTKRNTSRAKLPAASGRWAPGPWRCRQPRASSTAATGWPGCCKMIALALRLAHWRRVPMSMTACPRLGNTLLGRVDGYGADGAAGLMGCARFGSALGPRSCGASAARSAASRRRCQALRFGGQAPSRCIRAPIAPGCVQRSATSGIHRLSALENGRRRARGTGSRVGAGSWRRRRSGRVASREVSSAKRSDRRFRPRPGALLAGRDPRLSRL